MHDDAILNDFAQRRGQRIDTYPFGSTAAGSGIRYRLRSAPGL
jgi:hypothetical protein